MWALIFFLAAAPKTLMVAGCNTGCTDCSLAAYQTFVVGTTANGAKLFPSPDPPVPGYSCAASVGLGETVLLRARSPEGLVLERWEPFFATDYCPCAGTAAPVCRVKVTAAIAERYPRVYCGAIWKRRAVTRQ